MPEFLVAIQQFGGELVQSYGLWGVAAAMLMESAGVPFISAVVLLTAGGMVLSGKAGFPAMMLASTAGIILGSVISYIVGFLGGSLGRVMGNQLRSRRAVKKPCAAPSRWDKIYAFIEKYGTYSIFMGQLWGVTRTFISFPAGAMHMNPAVFILSTALGGAIFSLWIIGWSIIFTGAAGIVFRLLRIIHSLSPWVWPVLIIFAAALVYFYRRLGWRSPLAAFRARFKKR